MHKLALIPAYEPTESMIDLLKELKEKDFEIIIVNDGSGKTFDDIFEKSKKYGTVLTHEINKGKGAGLKTGIKYIKEKYINNFIIITMDCDGQHTVKDADKLYDYAKYNVNTLVLGKRIRGKKTPLRSKLGNSITRFVYKITTGLDVYDTQTGLRAFSDNLVDFLLDVEGERFEYEMNVLLKCSSNKIKIKEIEIETIYIDNNSHSHFNTVKDSFRVYKEIIKFSMSSIISFIVDYLLFSVFILLSDKIVLSNISARIISSIVNYNINEKIVFKSKESKLTSAIKYFGLAIVILILNSCILKLFVDYIELNKFISKLITEIILFIFSWSIQKLFVFKTKK